METKSERKTEKPFAKMAEVNVWVTQPSEEGQHDYDQFKLSSFNRDPSHYKKVKESIEENDYTMYQPILVDKSMNIVDGQNRFLACKELGLPIYFIVSQEIHIYAAAEINQASKNWGAMDYARHYAQRGKEAYVELLDRCAKYDQRISVVGSFGKMKDGARSVSHNIKKGTFEFREDIDIDAFFDHMSIFEQYFDFAKKEKFVKAMLKLYMHPNYFEEKMEQKLKLNSSIVREQSKVGDMADELVKLYNFHTRAGKISF
jgi:hypothetical protein